ncbi:unnamed protein product (mitochondrion) [Plasmodiophora brassicae]|uniref:Uncharacterized protein n=1 Tax=Plasmodiophora brassicae TaxID=37360 RepID=A0A0G4ITK7_PLABS|nr:hypothetical protein PBRA_006742 [Plasmodiophora brassicae]SPR00764.1 unnamed protein product [Plasmodiophora brassicae]
MDHADESLFQKRVRKINDDLWPSFSERIADQKGPPSAHSNRKKAMHRRPEGTTTNSTHTAHTISSLRKMDEFVRLICQQPARIPKKVDHSSLRPVLKHVQQMERAVEQLQEEHSTQIRLETESQKTFEFMKNQIDSMRKAFGILSEVLIDEIEDIRTVMSDHMKVLIAYEAKFRGKLAGGPDVPIKEQINKVRTEMDNKVSIIHSNMLQLQSAIEESRESSHGEVSTLENKVQELERRSVATQNRGGGDDRHMELAEAVKRLAQEIDRTKSDFESYQDAHGVSLSQIFAELNKCIHRCDQLEKGAPPAESLAPKSSASSSGRTRDEDVAALEANIDAISTTVKDFIVTQTEFMEEDHASIVREATEAAKQQVTDVREEMQKQNSELRLDLDQIEESVINGFDQLCKVLNVHNPLELFEKSEPGNDKDSDNELADGKIEPFT